MAHISINPSLHFRLDYLRTEGERSRAQEGSEVASPSGLVPRPQRRRRHVKKARPQGATSAASPTTAAEPTKGHHPEDARSRNVDRRVPATTIQERIGFVETPPPAPPSRGPEEPQDVPGPRGRALSHSCCLSGDSCRRLRLLRLRLEVPPPYPPPRLRRRLRGLAPGRRKSCAPFVFVLARGSQPPWLAQPTTARAPGRGAWDQPPRDSSWVSRRGYNGRFTSGPSTGASTSSRRRSLDR